MTLRGLVFITFCFLLTNCQSPKPTSSQDPLLAFFPKAVQKDTLYVEISDSEAPRPPGDSIPNALFFSTIPSDLLQEIDYVADSTADLILGRAHFSLDDQTEAYWVEMRQFWFQHHSLLVYDKVRKVFTDRITLAEWYGGEGGQILIGSWLFDYDGDGKKDIVRRQIEHQLLMLEDGTVEDRFNESASLVLWQKGAFAEMPLKDTAATIQRYPIRSMW